MTKVPPGRAPADVTFTVQKIFPWGQKKERKLKLTRVGIENVRGADSTSLHNYNSIVASVCLSPRRGVAPACAQQAHAATRSQHAAWVAARAASPCAPPTP